MVSATEPLAPEDRLDPTGRRPLNDPRPARPDFHEPTKPLVASLLAFGVWAQAGAQDDAKEALDLAVHEGRDRVVLKLCEAEASKRPLDAEWCRAAALAARNVGMTAW